MARVNVDQKAHTDPRFELLGRLMGTNRHEALGRMILVWNECQERGSYFLPAKLVGAILGHNDGANWLIESDLAMWQDEIIGELRIKGTEGRIEWLDEKRRNGKKYGHLGAGHGKKGGRPKKPGKGVSKTGSGGSAETRSPGLNNPPPAPAPAPAKEEDPTGGAASPPLAKEATDVKPPRKPAEGVHAEFIRIFVDAWQVRYGEKYPFAAGKDASAITWMRKQTAEDAGKFRAIVARYIGDEDPFVANSRHNLGLLMGQFAKWLVDRPPVAKKSGFQTHDERVMNDILPIIEAHHGTRTHDGQSRPATKPVELPAGRTAGTSEQVLQLPQRPAQRSGGSGVPPSGVDQRGRVAG